jgi:hypothetical protein
MKGQYNVVNELLLFGIGAVLAISVAFTISNLIIPLKIHSQKEQYYIMSNLVSLAATKTYLCSKYGECILSVNIPEKLSEDRYSILVDNNDISVYNFKTRERSSIEPIYYDINLEGFVTSSSRYFVFEGNEDLIFSKW